MTYGGGAANILMSDIIILVFQMDLVINLICMDMYAFIRFTFNN